MRFLTGLFNLFWVNLLFLFTSIPIITIGPSLCALYKVCIQMVSGDDPQVYSTYFREFKNSFKKGLLLWLGILALGGFFAYELYLIYFTDMVGDSFSFLQYPVWVMILLIVQVFLYGFALLAIFENTLKNTIKNAILLSIKHFAITIFLVVCWLFTPIIVNTFPNFFYGAVGLELFINMALRVFICSVFLHKAFDLKKIKVARDGSLREISYDDMIEYADDGSDGENEEEGSSESDEDSDEESDEDPGEEPDDGPEEGPDEETDNSPDEESSEGSDENEKE